MDLKKITKISKYQLIGIVVLAIALLIIRPGFVFELFLLGSALISIWTGHALAKGGLGHPQMAFLSIIFGIFSSIIAASSLFTSYNLLFNLGFAFLVGFALSIVFQLFGAILAKIIT